jgi:hypothetical protein
LFFLLNRTSLTKFMSGGPTFQCLVDNNFAYDVDDCIRNPVNCAEGFTASVFFMSDFDDAIKLIDGTAAAAEEFIISTGGTDGQPGARFINF